MEYTILNPCGVRQPIKRQPISPRLDTLEGKTVYVVAQDRPFFTEEVSKRLAAALPNTKIVYRKKPGWIRVADQELWDEIFANADALIYGTCMGGGSGMSAVTWVGEAERKGIPCVYIAGSVYERDIKMSAVMRGMPAMRTVIVTLVGEENVTGDMSSDAYAGIVTDLEKALTAPLTDEEKRTDDYITEAPPRIAMTGTYEEVQQYFIDKGWSDGLPIVPPTEEKVKEFLACTSHAPDEVVTTSMFPEELTVTVEKAAIVGVMAGCKPEYMPALLSIIEIWGSSPSFAQAARSDSTFCIMTVVNGPLRDELGMNKGSNAMGPGNRANATLGRFLRLGIFSLGGSIPGVNDLSAQGNPVKYGWCFPEHEEESPWEPFHVSHGFKKDDSVITLMHGAWCHWSFSADLDHLSTAVANFSDFGGGTIIMSLEAARHYHKNKSMSKADIAKYILEHSLAEKPQLKTTWYNIDMPFIEKDDKKKKEPPMVGQGPAVHLIVVGGETSQPIAQAWSCSTPVSLNVAKWR